jgi:hypothetical protein
MFRVIKNAGGMHALAIIEDLLAEAGLTDQIDTTALAAAYAAAPNDMINARFEGGGGSKFSGVPDVASWGMPIADALKEIAARMLYWIFTDAGLIKIVPYTATAPTSPALSLTSNNHWENTQTIDLESINSFVSAIYGWYSRNPTLFYLAGDQTAGVQGTALDYSWDSPVACENLETIKSKVDLFLKFLSAQERMEPVRMGLAGARLELMDTVSIDDALLYDAPTNYAVMRKEIGLDPGSREVNLQLMRFLG